MEVVLRPNMPAQICDLNTAFQYNTSRALLPSVHIAYTRIELDCTYEVLHSLLLKSPEPVTDIAALATLVTGGCA